MDIDCDTDEESVRIIEIEERIVIVLLDDTMKDEIEADVTLVADELDVIFDVEIGLGVKLLLEVAIKVKLELVDVIVIVDVKLVAEVLLNDCVDVKVL